MKYTNMLKHSNFETTIDSKEIKLYRLVNTNGMIIDLSNFGATVLAIIVPDKNGNMDDIVLGYDHINDYISKRPFYGSTIGRYANRIKKGKFDIDGIPYQLEVNDSSGNHLHGGSIGFDNVVWNCTSSDDKSIIFSYISQDGAGNYPGKVNVSIQYTLTNDNKLVISYKATTDKTTIINLTHHSFFNLKGEGNGDVLNHKLMINATQYTPVDDQLIVTGEIRNVVNTPMDFIQYTKIGSRIKDNDTQLKFGKGYDHNWILKKSNDEINLAAKVYEPESGRTMEVYTDQPGVQFYSSNHLDGSDIGKSGKSYQQFGALCLETQHFPDSPNHPEFPSTLLNPGAVYDHTCIYKFDIKQ